MSASPSSPHPPRPPRPPRHCAYCGSEENLTKDHLPPKALFPVPRPSNLITVDACEPCNNGFGKDDEEFAALMSVRLGEGTPTTDALWRQRALRTFGHNQRFRRQILDEAELVDVQTPGGICLGQRFVVPFSAKVYTRSLKRLTRGLYWHLYREVLPATTSIATHWYTTIDDEMASLMKPLHLGVVGDNQFIFRGGRADDCPAASLWFFVFHGRHIGGAITSPYPLEDEDDEEASDMTNASP